MSNIRHISTRRKSILHVGESVADAVPSILPGPEELIFFAQARGNVLRVVDYSLTQLATITLPNSVSTSTVEAMATSASLNIAVLVADNNKYVFSYNKNTQAFALESSFGGTGIRSRSAWFATNGINWYSGAVSNALNAVPYKWSTADNAAIEQAFIFDQAEPLIDNGIADSAIGVGGGDRVYEVRENDGAYYLVRRHRTTLKVEWTRALTGYAVSGSVPSGGAQVRSAGLPDGSVLMCNFASGIIYRYNDSGTKTLEFNTNRENLGICADHNGDIYIVSIDLPGFAGFVSKYTSAGVLIWDQEFGQGAFPSMQAYAVATDSHSRIVVVGSGGNILLINSETGALVESAVFTGTSTNEILDVAIHPGNIGSFSELAPEADPTEIIWTTDFSVLGVTNMWPSQWTGFAGKDTVQETFREFGNGSLRLQTAGAGSARRAAKWLRVPDSTDDVELLTLFRTTSTETTQGGVVLRGGGASGTESGYTTLFGGGGASIVLAKFVNGASGTLANPTFAWLANTWYYVRMRAEGTAIKIRIWQHGSAEPETWLSEVTDGDLESGWVGVNTFQANGTKYFDFMSVNLSGGEAPLPS